MPLKSRKREQIYMPKVSVIIPVYNIEKYLKKCVESVEAQTYQDYKIILVDDGSTDESGKLCDALAQKNEKIIVIHQENKGLGGARNTGIQACDTDYIMFLDSDDYIHPQLLEKCLDTVKNNDCDIVLFDMINVDEKGKTGIVYGNQIPTNKVLTKSEKCLISKNPTACDKLYKTSLFKDNNIYYPEKVWYEDLRTTPKILLFADKIVRLESEPLYYYLQRSDSIMHTPDYDRIVKERIDAVDDLTDYFKANNFYDGYKDVLNFITVYHGFLLPCLEMYRKTGNHKKHIDVLLKTLKERVQNPLDNPYLALLRKNEIIILKLALKQRYFFISCITSFNRAVKKLKHN